MSWGAAARTACTLTGLAATGAALAAAREARAAREDAERLAQAEGARRRTAEGDLARARHDLRREHELVARLEQSRQAERHFNRELRRQLQESFDRQRTIAQHGTGGDVEALVLHAAVELVGAEKGILLANQDEDHDGRLDVAAVHGFEHDPSRSAVAERFARIVLDRDETIREDAPGDAAAEDRTPADDEIENLVAIPVYLRDRFHGVVVCANREGGFHDVDDDLLLALGDRAGDALHTGRLRSGVRDAQAAAVQMLVEGLAARDMVLHRQSAEAAVLASGFGEALGFDDRDREALVLATLLRDVGYIAVPERVLLHSGELTSDERSVVELHPRIGFQMLRRMPALHDVAYAVLYHHERVDGAGYPYGLSSGDIPSIAKAVAVLDAYSAMTNDRPHRDRRSPELACEELSAASGTQFDAEVTGRFIEHVRRRGPVVTEELVDAVVSAIPLAGRGVDDGTALGILTAPELDPLTRLGTLRACVEDLGARLEACEAGDLIVVLMVQAEEVGRLNEQVSHLAGDRLIEAAARSVERIAGRLTGEAFRVSGRRFAVVFPCDDERLEVVTAELPLEFVTGPSVTTAVVTGRRGDRPDQLLNAARAALTPAR